MLFCVSFEVLLNFLRKTTTNKQTNKQTGERWMDGGKGGEDERRNEGVKMKIKKNIIESVDSISRDERDVP